MVTGMVAGVFKEAHYQYIKSFIYSK